MGCVLLSVACGARDTEDDDGGGGGGGGGATAPITQGTAEAMAGAVMRAIVASADAAEAVDGAIPPDLGPLQAPDDEQSGRDIPATTSRAAFGPNLVACNIAGDVSLEGDVADTMTYTVTDFVMGDYMLCNYGTGFVFDGLMDFTVTSLSGDLLSASYAAILDANFDTFDVDGAILLNGNATVSLDTTGDPILVYGTTGASLTIGEGGESHVLTNFDTDREYNLTPAPDTYNLVADGRMTSSVFTGSVDYSTATDFDGEVGTPPIVGRLFIFGMNNARIELEAVNTTDVTLDIDLDGNGSIDALVNTTWTLLGVNNAF